MSMLSQQRESMAPARGNPATRLFRIRAGDYRAVYEKDGDTLMILLLGDRKQIYRILRRRR